MYFLHQWKLMVGLGYASHVSSLQNPSRENSSFWDRRTETNASWSLELNVTGILSAL